MAQPVIQPSFANGEFSPTLYARVDFQKYHSAAAKMRNFFVDYRGGASNRSGTNFVGQCKSNGNVRFIPFQFSTLQAYILEFSAAAIRVIKDGSYVLEATKAITGATSANPVVLTCNAHGYTNGDWVYVTGVGGMTQLNGRTFIVAGATANTFQLRDTITNTGVNGTTYSTYTTGGTVGKVYTITTPYTDGQIWEIKYTQSADVMTLVHPSWYPRDLTRTADNAWTLQTLTVAARLDPPTGLTAAASAVGAVMYAYQVTAVDESGDESTASNLVAITGVDITTTAGNVLLQWTPVAYAQYYNVYKANAVRGGSVGGSAANPAIPTLLGFIQTTQAPQSVDSNIAPDFSTTPPLARDPLSAGQVTSIDVTNGGAGYTSVPTVAITGGGAYAAGAEAGATVVNNIVTAVVVTRPGHDYETAPTVTISGGGGAGATATANIGPNTGTYPSVVAYFQQRRTFAASNNAPQTFWMSQPGLYSNYNVSNPSRPDDAITGTLASLQVNAIKHLIPMPGGLIALTSYGAWQITGGGQSSAITPANASAQAQAYNGVSDVQPIIINYDILYIQAKGSNVRDLSYNIYANIYTGVDISILSNHLFFGYTITSWGYAEAPYKIVWATRNDGTLLSLTFLKEQEVIGWAHHDTRGLFESVAVISEGNEDAIYVVVTRKIQGVYVKYAERFHTRNFNDNIVDAQFLDCALQTAVTYPAATLTPGAISGSNVTFTTSAAAFTAGDVGSVIRAGNGVATITQYNSTTSVVVNITTTLDHYFPDDPNNTPVPLESGEWYIAPVVSSVTNLWHLEGQTVAVFANGARQADKVVANGTVTLDSSAYSVTCGFPFTAQLQTLRVNTNNGQAPTDQGKRKDISALTVRVAATKGFKVGPDFSRLQNWAPSAQNFSGTTTNGLYTGDYRRTISQGWNVEGQICIEQSDPYPITVLGVIPELWLGDSK